MMMTRKTRLLVVGLIVLVTVLLALGLWFLLKPVTELVVEETQPDVQPEVVVIEDSQPTLKDEQLKQATQTRNESAEVTTVAKMFTTRYGSYSNEANFQNLIDVLPLMTDAFAKTTQAYVDSAVAPLTHYAVTTRVLTVDVEAYSEETGKSTMRLQTQRETSTDSTQNVNISYQDIRLEFIKTAGIWKVDSATWL